MRKLLILLLLVLSALWLYASWYWYTCIIKWFCPTNEVVMVEDSSTAEITPDENDKPVEKKIIQEEPKAVTVKPEVIEVSPEPKDTTPEPIATVEKKECQTLIVTPIKLWSQNDAGDVKDLEDFLNAFEGESLEVNWVYEQADVEAVKRLQLKYASEVLTPWGIKNPTGYVYKTTTKKINDIYCWK